MTMPQQHVDKARSKHRSTALHKGNLIKTAQIFMAIVNSLLSATRSQLCVSRFRVTFSVPLHSATRQILSRMPGRPRHLACMPRQTGRKTLIRLVYSAAINILWFSFAIGRCSGKFVHAEESRNSRERAKYSNQDDGLEADAHGEDKFKGKQENLSRQKH